MVGIFWVWRGEVLAGERTPVASGQRYGGAVCGWRDHAELWDELAAAGSLDPLPPELRGEYFSVPRGRVTWHADDGLFHVYHGGLDAETLGKVARAFMLPAGGWLAGTDLHYTDPGDDDWEGLLGPH